MNPAVMQPRSWANDMPTVPVGDSVYAVLSSDLDVGTPAENASQAETTGAFTASVLSPSRLQAQLFLFQGG